MTKAPDTPGAREALQHLNAHGHTVTTVSNNLIRAVRTYLRSRELTAYVHGISARESGRPLLLKPHPHLLQEAIIQLDVQPTDCVMIGDSVSDIHAAYRAKTAVIALASKPGKWDRFAPHQNDARTDRPIKKPPSSGRWLAPSTAR